MIGTRILYYSHTISNTVDSVMTLQGLFSIDKTWKLFPLPQNCFVVSQHAIMMVYKTLKEMVCDNEKHWKICILPALTQTVAKTILYYHNLSF